MYLQWSYSTNDAGSTGHARRATEYTRRITIDHDRSTITCPTYRDSHSLDTRRLPYPPIANIHTNNTQFGRATYPTRERKGELRGKFPVAKNAQTDDDSDVTRDVSGAVTRARK